MVLPLLIGGAALLGLGYIGLGVTSFFIHWASIGLGIAAALGALRYSLDNNPFPLADSEAIQNLLYLIGSAGLGFVSFHLATAILNLLGFSLVAIIVVLVLAAVFFSPALVIQILAGLATIIQELLGGN